MALFLAPSASTAEPLLLLHRVAAETRNVTAPTRQSVRHPVDVGLNDNGDMVIRRKAVALTVAYKPPDEFVEPQERIRIAQRQDSPSISGFSLKVSFLF